MLPLHSLHSLHDNEGKTHTEQPVILNVSPAWNSSSFFLILKYLNKLTPFPFCPISFQFQNGEHENQSMAGEHLIQENLSKKQRKRER